MKNFLKKILTRPLYLILIAVIILVVFGALRYLSGKNKSSYEFVEVKRGTILQEVSVTGRVKPAQDVKLAFEKSGKVAKINVEVGDSVIVGQVLISLENADLAAQVTQAQANLAVQQAKLNELNAGTRAEELQIAETNVANAQKSLQDGKNNLINVKNKAEIDLNNVYKGIKDTLNDCYVKADDAVNKQIDDMYSNDNTDNPILTFRTSSQYASDAQWKRRQAGTELTQFKQELDNLTDDRASLELALSKGESHLKIIQDFLNTLSNAVNEATDLTSTTLASYKYNVNLGRTNVATAISNINTEEQDIATQKATNQSNISTAEASVNTAENNLLSAQNTLALKRAGSTKEQIDAQAAQVQSARASLQSAQAQLAKTVISSPINGIVTEKNTKVGEIAAANTSLISVLSTAGFEIESNISENEISKVNLGDIVEMTLDALGPTEKFYGRVIKIDPAETIVSGVIYYKVTAVFDSEDNRIKSGMTVNLDIQTEKKTDVLYLPYYTVKSRNGDHYIQVLVNNQLREKTVITGLEGETTIEIVSGLDEGEKIVVTK